MEVTPEMYAWLTDINVINPFGSLKSEMVGNFMLPEKTVKLLLGGKYLENMLTALQSAYNKFYKLKLDYLSKLKDLKEISEDQEYISNSVKYSNWHLINEMLNQFGISYTEEQINQVINGDRDFLLKVITQIFYLCNQFLKHCTNDENKKDSDKDKNKDINQDKQSVRSLNKTKQKAVNRSTISSINNNENISKKKEDNNKNKENKNKKSQSVNINDIDPNKSYEDCSTALEFFILSLSKNMDMKPRQAVALLSNNRKYLSVICSKGFKGDYSKVKKWLKDISLHSEIMMRLIPKDDDGLNVSFGTIGTALCCPDDSISLLSAQLLNKLNLGIKMNWSWLKDEGASLIINSLINYQKDDDKFELLNILYDFIKDNQNNFFLELRKKLASSEKNSVMEMLSNIIPICKNLNVYFFKDIQSLIYDICLSDSSINNNETNNNNMTINNITTNNNKSDDDTVKKISLISDSFYYFNTQDEKIIDKTINFYKKCVRNNNSKTVYSSAIVQNFNLMEKFGKKKIKYAPTLYKNLVFLFLENYDNEEKRQFILENFEHFFNDQQQIPIDIFLEPYIDQLNSSSNFSLCDLEFIFKIIEHPRIQSKDLYLIIKFLLSVTNKNENLIRTVNVILSLIFEKRIIEKVCSVQDREKISNEFINFINNTFDLFIKGIKKKEKRVFLETPYDIITEDIPTVNENVKLKLMNSIKSYRKIKNKNSSALLAMLWFYPEHDDFLLNVEEENRPIYDSVEDLVKKMKQEQDKIERQDFGKRINKEFDEIKNKRINESKNSEIKNQEKKKKEDKIKKNLEERRKIDRILSGAEQVKKPRILFDDEETNISTVLPTIPEKNYRGGGYENYKTEHSNMLSAIDNATKKLMAKGAISPLNTDGGEKKYKKNNYLSNKKMKLNEYQDKKKDDVIEKYGKIESVGLLKKKEDALREYKKKIRIQSIKNFILPEGTLIKILPNGLQEPQDPSKSKKYSIFITKNKNYNYPLNLEEEEERERKAIDGYSYEFRRNTKFYFKCYATSEYQQTISKKNIMKMLRDRGINKSRLDLEEMNQVMRCLFNNDIDEIDYNKFSDLLVQLSYLIFIKKRPSLTIGECYGNLIRRFTLKENTENTENLKQKMEPAIDLLLEKKENQEPYNLPDGFKFVLKSKVKYNNRLAPHFEEILGESKFICYQILEDIIFNIFKTSIIEPYVELEVKNDIQIEPEKIKKWTPATTMAYISMGPEFKEYGKIACDALEEGFKNFYKGKNIYGENLIAPNDKKILEDNKSLLRKQQKQAYFMAQRKVEIDEKLEEYKKQKEEKRREKLRERQLLRNKAKEALLLVREKFAKVEERRKKIEEEKKNKIKSEQEKKEEKEEQKNKALLEFYRDQRRKLKEQFNAIKDRKAEYLASFEGKGDGGEKELKKSIKFSGKPNYLQKDKEYCEFENNLYNTMKDLMENDNIKKVLDKYDKHIKFIYDVYSKIGYNKISFFSQEVIGLNEFKQFLINFTVLGLLISTDQMIWIFNKIAKQNQGKRDNQVFLNFEDFQMSLCFLAVFARFTERSRKLMPSDISNTDGEVIESFMKFLGLKKPYKKTEMENFINDRRGMTMKTLLDIQRKMKTDANDYKNGEYDKEEQKKKDEKIKKMESLRRQKKKEREEDSGEGSGSDEENGDGDEDGNGEGDEDEGSGNGSKSGNESGGD